MPWDRRSRRHDELPPDWPIIRRDILNRDHRRCRIAGPPCIGTATEVDHIDDPHNHHRDNLRAACQPCHAQRSASQGGTANATQAARARHPRERHPFAVE